MGRICIDGGMAMKLYWRVKINNKWTWRPANVIIRPEGFIVVPNNDGTWFDGDGDNAS